MRRCEAIILTCHGCYQPFALQGTRAAVWRWTLKNKTHPYVLTRKLDTVNGPKFCSVACFKATRLREGTRWPVSPRGPEYCRAPVPGGCDRLRCPKGRATSSKPFCYAHDKRRQRGGRIDLPCPHQPYKHPKIAGYILGNIGSL